ncbi:MAG: hypothetical protein HY600_01830 [Candidatus Omnitrophica bacterium]|nr:hypothetical protein [Candidatus Omnitrophota bacterium]
MNPATPTPCGWTRALALAVALLLAVPPGTVSPVPGIGTVNVATLRQQRAGAEEIATGLEESNQDAPQEFGLPEAMEPEFIKTGHVVLGLQSVLYDLARSPQLNHRLAERARREDHRAKAHEKFSAAALAWRTARETIDASWARQQQRYGGLPRVPDDEKQAFEGTLAYVTEALRRAELGMKVTARVPPSALAPPPIVTPAVPAPAPEVAKVAPAEAEAPAPPPERFASTSTLRGYVEKLQAEAPRRWTPALVDECVRQVQARLRPLLDAQDPSSPFRELVRKVALVTMPYAPDEHAAHWVLTHLGKLAESQDHWAEQAAASRRDVVDESARLLPPWVVLTQWATAQARASEPIPLPDVVGDPARDRAVYARDRLITILWQLAEGLWRQEFTDPPPSAAGMEEGHAMEEDDEDDDVVDSILKGEASIGFTGEQAQGIVAKLKKYTESVGFTWGWVQQLPTLRQGERLWIFSQAGVSQGDEWISVVAPPAQRPILEDVPTNHRLIATVAGRLRPAGDRPILAAWNEDDTVWVEVSPILPDTVTEQISRPDPEGLRRYGITLNIPGGTDAEGLPQGTQGRATSKPPIRILVMETYPNALPPLPEAAGMEEPDKAAARAVAQVEAAMRGGPEQIAVQLGRAKPLAKQNVRRVIDLRPRTAGPDLWAAAGVEYVHRRTPAQQQKVEATLASLKITSSDVLVAETGLIPRVVAFITAQGFRAGKHPTVIGFSATVWDAHGQVARGALADFVQEAKKREGFLLIESLTIEGRQLTIETGA